MRWVYIISSFFQLIIQRLYVITLKLITYDIGNLFFLKFINWHINYSKNRLANTKGYSNLTVIKCIYNTHLDSCFKMSINYLNQDNIISKSNKISLHVQEMVKGQGSMENWRCSFFILARFELHVCFLPHRKVPSL